MLMTAFPYSLSGTLTLPLDRPQTSGLRTAIHLDGIDTVRVEGDVILDLRHRFKWGLISPHRIDGTIPANRYAVVGRVALVGAIGRMFASRERRHIHIPMGDILNCRIGGLAKCQRAPGVGDDLSANSDHDAR